MFPDTENASELAARVQLVARHFPGENFPELGEARLHSAIRQLCNEKRSFAELSRLLLVGAMLGFLSARQRQKLNREAPEKIMLRTGRNVRVHYDSARLPWIESRLQDFIGINETPRICSGKVPLTIHLLAPNGRPVQVTQDLAGFWQRHYPAIKRELERRYPKHEWP
jgi:ATP-dependent helicase HrpB